MVAGSLGGRIGTVGRVGRGLGEGRVCRAQRAIHLVGGDVQEAEAFLVGALQRAPVGAHRFEQVEGADHVGLDEIFGAVDRSVHMAFGGEVDHGARPVLRQQPLHQRTVADVALHEDVTGVAAQAGQILGIAGVGELVEIDHRLLRLLHPVQHEICTNEACGASYQNHLFSYVVRARHEGFRP